MSEMTDGVTPAWTRGWRMQRALAHAGIGVDEMASELGVSRSTVSRWVNDRGEPRRAYLRVWALRCGVSLSWLTGEVPAGGSRNQLTEAHALGLAA